MSFSSEYRIIAMRNPLKQGLKQILLLLFSVHLLIAMRNPLKQGLKLQTNAATLRATLIAMRNPLKQGLKLFVLLSLTLSETTYRNAKSTKTRIETAAVHLAQPLERQIAMRNPLKQGLKLVTAGHDELFWQIAMRNPLKQGLKLFCHC